MTPEQVRDFMLRVVPWPGDESAPGYVNLHWLSPNHGDPGKTGKESYWSGKWFKKVDDFLSMAAWCLGKPNIKDIYFCLSQQSSLGKTKNNKPKVLRLQQNVSGVKALWLDLDVKAAPKGYASITEALDELEKFIQKENLPRPSALVASGGGLHVYWFSDRALTRDEWQPYANGLKAIALEYGLRCDAGVTVDSARVLRVPGTFNHKTTPPKPVKLLGLLPAADDYNFLATFAALHAKGNAVVSTAKPTDDFGIGALGAPSNVFAAAGATESLSEGIGRPKSDAPLDIMPLYKECAFFREALRTGGKDYSQPMWNLTTLLSTFMEHGSELAHKLGDQHPGYSPQSTESLYDRKERERHERGLGWPSCSAIQASGCGACAACPHLGKGKSPLHLTQAVVAAPVTAPVTGFDDGICADCVVDGRYELDKDGHISKVVEIETENGQPPTKAHLKLFTCKLTNAWTEKGGGQADTLNFVTTVDKANTRPVSITHPEIASDTERSRVLAHQGVKVFPENKRHVEGYLMALMTKLHDAIASQEALPFGWVIDAKSPSPKTKGDRHGFTFGGVTYLDTGKVRPSGRVDPEVREAWKPVGDKEPWLKACHIINDLQKPQLDAIIAAAFASPLMCSTGQYSSLLSVWGTSSSKKSSAMKVAIAVWAHPVKGKESLRSTAKSVGRKMGSLRHLPIFWDEVKEADQQKQVYSTFFTATEGIEEGRLKSDLSQQTRGTWQNILTCNSNKSFVNYILTRQKDTDAGINRVFEMRIEKDEVGQINQLEAERIIQELEQHHGAVGSEYAQILGTDPDAVDRRTVDTTNQFQTIVNYQDGDRYWLAICGALLTGAEYANELGAQIDIPELWNYVRDVYALNAKRREQAIVVGGTISYTEDKLTQFLRHATGHMVWTDTYNEGAGKPKLLNVFHGPIVERGHGIYAQWAVFDGLLRVARQPLIDFFDKQELPAQSVIDGLVQHMGAVVKGKRTLCAGSPYILSRETVVEVPIPPASSLFQLMNAHTKDEDYKRLEESRAVGETDAASVDAALARGIVQAQKDMAVVTGATGPASSSQ